MSIERQKELYIQQASQAELTGVDETTHADRAVRIRFWQSLSSEDRMCAMTEIVRRVHLANGGSEADLTVNRSLARFVKTRKY